MRRGSVETRRRNLWRKVISLGKVRNAGLGMGMAAMIAAWGAVMVSAGNTEVANAMTIQEGNVAALPVAGQGQGAQSNGSLWPQYRHDDWLSGRSPLKGGLAKEPSIAWSVELGGSPAPKESWRVEDINGDGRAEVLRVLQDGIVCEDAVGNRLWECEGLPNAKVSDIRDFAGDGSRGLLVDADTGTERQVFIVSGTTGEKALLYTMRNVFGACRRIGRILPGVPGQQICAWWSGETIQNAVAVCEGWVFSFERGAANPTVRFQVKEEGGIYAPLHLIADMDGDGRADMVMISHEQVWVYDLETSERKMYANWGPQIRTYWALIGAMPLKRGELPSLLMINPMLPGLKVVSQDGKTAGEKWKVVVGAVENQYQHEVKIGGGAPDPFIDLDGDGQIEMMAAITNEHGDNKTYLAIFGADNGARLFDAPDLMVLAAQDLDGDGRLEVFLKQADGVLRIANWNGKEFVDRWRGEGAEPLFAPAPPEQDLTRSAGAVVTLKNPQVLRLTEDDPAFLMSFGGEVYRCLLKPQGSLERVGGVVHLESEAEAEQARLRRQGIAWDGRTLVVTENGQEKARRSVPFETVYMAPPALAGTLGGETRVIVRDAGGTILSLSADGTQRRPLVGNVPAFSNVNHSTEYPRLCDVDGDGEAELLTSAIMPDGKAAVVAVGGDGMIGLRIDMPENAGLMSLGPSGKQGPGEGRWVAVRYYGVMGSSWGNNAWVVAYDGASGKELWRRDSFGKYGDRDVIFALHTPTSVLDFNGDGTDDFLAQSENFYNVVSGRDGQDLIPMDDFSDSVPGHWTAYSTPMLLDLNGDGNPKVFFSRAFALTIVTDIKGNPIWHYGLTRDTTARSRPGIGDLDGNGETEIVVSQQDGVLTAFGARPLDGKCPTCDPSQPLTERNHSGSVIWNYNLKPPVSDIATADLDGDGCDELLVGAGDGRLYALKQRGGACVVLWFVDLGRAVGSPILADLDGDGQAEIVVPTEDGRLHCLKGQQTAR